MQPERDHDLPVLAHSVLDLIGKTPMLELHRLKSELQLEGRLLVKCDLSNPGLSKKDRVALWMVHEATRLGQLQPGQTVVEMTSGNTGTGLALVCAALGHPFVAVMSCGNTPERAAHMRALGAEVVLVDQLEDSISGQVTGNDLKLVEAEADRIATERNAFRAGQFSNVANVMAHEQTTGPEMWEQSSGEMDVFVDCIGTAGTFTGVSRYLKSRKPGIRCYVVEPQAASVLKCVDQNLRITPKGHKIQGAGYARADEKLPLFDRTLADGFISVTDEDSIKFARMLARLEGILGGFSTGAHLAAAVELLRTTERGKTIGFVICDSGLKYLSTDLY
ncbi:MAG: cysteine synthase family protein [Planctomycetota bacterium]|nr:cysteine synthase family protein [Planctomycetota bacterium]